MSKHIIDSFKEAYNVGKPIIIEPTEEAVDEYGHGYGSDLTLISREDIEALIEGKALAFSDGEYKHFLVMG